MDSEPRIIDVVIRTLRTDEPSTRLQIRLTLLLWGFVLAVQIWDMRGRHGLPVVAEMTGAVLFTAGTILVALMFALRNAGTREATTEGLASAPADAAAIRQVLLALPAVGFIAGTLLAAGIATLFARLLLGASPVILVPAAANVAVLVVAARVSSGATRTMYSYAQEQAAAAARAEGEAARGRLAALQAQMQPHFLFNALNTVASLVRTDPRAAETTVENLSDVLRRTLERTGAATSTLADEIDYIKAYLGVEQQRFGDRLIVDWDVPSGVLPADVPPLTLQPLVENAIRHGVGPRRAGGRLRIGARRDGDRLRLVVEDDGEGFPERMREGTGLTNLRTRLDVLYGGKAAVRIERPQAGSRVVVDLPGEICCVS